MLSFFACLMQSLGQTAFYYYQGMKIPLTLNEDKLCICVPVTCENISERIQTDIFVADMIKDEEFDIFVVAKSDFDNLTLQDSWDEESKSVILSSCYFTENGDEVFATPYLNVKLKTEQDINLLSSYVEDYKLRIVTDMPTLSLWYVLSLTPESKKNTLECANEIWESGNFAASLPDFVDITSNKTDVRPNCTTKSEKFYVIRDLYGRLPNSIPPKGIYIKSGKKYVVK